ncbi:hypothetical protein AVEN_38837-1 [Araneus ventricosus]|uniref:Uncharacterized protein n=1 Tax=Araneus ventricosus TaxID=182803 RepID=A0A4Y2CX93_ARAVE|nr:hypothetical protein AVEN_176441-1 [Araneus ventricosus]GBM07955.1 hypothetical protein AVEN_38837-1 [Araneus ventricosus]
MHDGSSVEWNPPAPKPRTYHLAEFDSTEPYKVVNLCSIVYLPQMQQKQSGDLTHPLYLNRHANLKFFSKLGIGHERMELKQERH